jgi:beta-phosphoglucomutase
MVIFSETLKANAVIFDFDGVIVDTEPLHYKAFQRILEPLGLGFSWDEYVDTYMGFDDRDAFKEAFQAKGHQLSQTELNKLVCDKALVFQDVILDGVTAYPGVVELITKLHTSKIPLAICSGALLSDIVPILELLQISDCFDLIVTADDVQKSKPDPESYQLAFHKLRALHTDKCLSLDNTIVIEDTPAGIKSATNAGLRVIAVTNSYPKESLTTASHIVESLKSLL